MLFPTAVSRRRHGLGLSLFPLPTPLSPAHDVGSCLRQSLSNRSEGVKGLGGGAGWGVWRTRTRTHTHTLGAEISGFVGFSHQGQSVRGRVCVCVWGGHVFECETQIQTRQPVLAPSPPSPVINTHFSYSPLLPPPLPLPLPCALDLHSLPPPASPPPVPIITNWDLGSCLSTPPLRFWGEKGRSLTPFQKPLPSVSSPLGNLRALLYRKCSLG